MTVYSNNPDDQEEPVWHPPADDNSWRCVSEMGIKETRLLFGCTSLMLEHWDNFPDRPKVEKDYLTHLHTKLFAMITDYNYTHQTSPDK